MPEFKSLLLVISLLVILTACGDSNNKSATQSAESNTNIAATNAPKPTKAKNPNKKTVPTSNAKTVIISGKDATVKSGGDICIEVQVTNFVDVISMQYSTNWDTNSLQEKGVQNFVLKDLNKQNFGRGKDENSSLRLAWYTQDLKGVTLFDGATIYQHCFKAIGKSGTTTEVDFSDKPIIGEIANSKMQRINNELKSVKITIE